MARDPHNGMRWPGIKAKAWPITPARVPGWALWGCGPVEFYGAWCVLHIGPWLIFIGRGRYAD